MSKRIAVFSAGVELPEVKNAIKMLNYKTNNEFDFKLFSEEKIKSLIENMPEKIHRILEIPSVSVDGVTCTIADYSLPLYDKIREKLEAEYSYEYLIIITPFNLFQNETDAKEGIEKFGSDYAGYFVLDNNFEHKVGKTSIISVKNLDTFSKRANRKIETSITFFIISSLVMLLTKLDLEHIHLDHNKNTTSVGCLNDYCESLDEVVPALMSLDFCQTCQNELKKEEYGKKILQITNKKREIPWYYEQHSSFWLSIGLIPIGIVLLVVGNLNEETILNSVGTASTVIGSFLLGLSRIINQNKR